jgi:hypothetical protein
LTTRAHASTSSWSSPRLSTLKGIWTNMRFESVIKWQTHAVENFVHQTFHVSDV